MSHGGGSQRLKVSVGKQPEHLGVVSAEIPIRPSRILNPAGAGFTLMGTDNYRISLAWGTGTTSFGYMVGEYWAARGLGRLVHF